MQTSTLKFSKDQAERARRDAGSCKSEGLQPTQSNSDGGEVVFFFTGDKRAAGDGRGAAVRGRRMVCKGWVHT
jgi:hypothetical protein